ncbi:MAG: radical SAM protein [Methanobacterium sp. BRmetb2]|nr:MAG: radical SAM protein [Methanobacterium sp. BRmetb2]
MMNINKLKILSDSAQYDLCNYVTPSVENIKNGEIPGVYNATSPNGCFIPLFKVLMTNKCNNDCKYCTNHSKRKFSRLEYSPEELSDIFLDYYYQNMVDGLFLSSGVSKDIDNTMEKMIEVTRLLRVDHGYKGYIHLKILPGSSYDMIKRAMSLSDRVSINIEAATPDGFQELTSTKDYQKDILKRMKWIKRISNKNPEFAPSGQTTQFIIGANNESDEEILKRVKWLSNNFGMKRSYYSPFQPLKETPLENLDKPEPMRAPRLYQADYLINYYGFNLNELIFDGEGNLSVDEDPKYLMALNNPEKFPVEINSASFKELITVPGIGKISALRILHEKRKGHVFNKLEELKKLGAVIKRAEPFVKFKGVYQATLD